MQDNYRQSQFRDAVNSQMFYFRKNILPDSDEKRSKGHQSQPQSHDHEYEQMNADLIMNGNVSKIYLHSTTPRIFS